MSRECIEDWCIGCPLKQVDEKDKGIVSGMADTLSEQGTVYQPAIEAIKIAEDLDPDVFSVPNESKLEVQHAIAIAIAVRKARGSCPETEARS